jgi:hypothetical protein
MDVDGNQRKTLIPPSCYHCGKPRHKVPDCPLRFDIRALTTGELEAELEARFARQDTILAEECPSIAEEATLVADFFSDNK